MTATPDQNQVRTIDGKGKTIKEILSGRKFYIDYYQREFKWQTKQVEELLNDLTGVFLISYEPNHERERVADYDHYFLGSIIVSRKGGKDYVIDGQQRLTTLSLLLMHLLHLLTEAGEDSDLSQLIYSKKHGKLSFNLDVDERRPVMEAIYNATEIDDASMPESCQNIVARYKDIKELLPDDVTGAALPYFADWLTENVHLVEITAYSDDVAYTIFETMNDRGLSLSPTDMLKGYLLANVTMEADRTRASTQWKKMIADLRALDPEPENKESDTDFFKAWLRSQHAESIRERKKNAKPGEWDRIGSEFHRWVRDHAEDRLSLKNSAAFREFILAEMAFFAKWYLVIRGAERAPQPGLENLHHNASHQFTHQRTLLLASLLPSDSDDVIRTKLRLVAKYIDIFLTRRLCNFTKIDYNTMQYNVFLVTKSIRGKTVAGIAKSLKERLGEQVESLSGFDTLHLNQWSHKPIKRILARLIDFVEVGAGGQARYKEYVEARGNKAYEVEHIWADQYTRHRDEFGHPNDFADYRNRFGGLLLLPKQFNASYGDKPYAKKLEHYFGQNIVAKSLNPKAYEHNPGFKRLIREAELPFLAHKEFTKADLDTRQALYRKIGERIWDPIWIDKIVDGNDAIP